MNKMKIEILVLGPVQTNCYLIQNCETKEILVVDPADRESRIRQKAEEMGGQIRAILLTHGHFDHITAVEELRRRPKRLSMLLRRRRSFWRTRNIISQPAGPARFRSGRTFLWETKKSFRWRDSGSR